MLSRQRTEEVAQENRMHFLKDSQDTPRLPPQSPVYGHQGVFGAALLCLEGFHVDKFCLPKAETRPWLSRLVGEPMSHTHRRLVQVEQSSRATLARGVKPAVVTSLVPR